ncbi:hypothetical protein ACQP3F_33145, partial [Escherichia coli]
LITKNRNADAEKQKPWIRLSQIDVNTILYCIVYVYVYARHSQILRETKNDSAERILEEHALPNLPFGTS